MNKKYTINFTESNNRFFSKRTHQLLLSLFLSFICLTPPSFADNCEATKECMDFVFEDKTDNNDGTTTFCFNLTNNCNRALSHVAFSVPQAATSPADNSVYSSISGIDYFIENTTNNPFLSIKFETIGEGFKNGNEDQFCFDLPSSIDYNSITIEAKASNKKYRVTLDLSDCISSPCDNLPLLDGGAIGVVTGPPPAYPVSEATVIEGAPFIIQNVMEPFGGSGDIEVIWIKCTGSDGSSDCKSRFEELVSINVGEMYNAFIANQSDARIGNTCWEFVMDSDPDDNSLIVNGISSSTCFVRCSRSVGCVPFEGESNIVMVNTQPAAAMLASSEDEFTNRDLITYPNPAYDHVSILTDASLSGQKANIIICNRLGQVMMQTQVELEKYSPIRLNTSSLPGGLYSVYLKIEGRKSIGKKLVISRL